MSGLVIAHLRPRGPRADARGCRQAGGRRAGTGSRRTVVGCGPLRSGIKGSGEEQLVGAGGTALCFVPQFVPPCTCSCPASFSSSLSDMRSGAESTMPPTELLLGATAKVPSPHRETATRPSPRAPLQRPDLLAYSCLLRLPTHSRLPLFASLPHTQPHTLPRTLCRSPSAPRAATSSSSSRSARRRSPRTA